MNARRWAVGAAVAVGSLVAAAAVSHLPSLRRYLPVGCPVARDAATLEAGRRSAVGRLRGAEEAPRRTFAGYTLGQTAPEALPSSCVWEIPRGLARCPREVVGLMHQGTSTVRFDGHAMVGLDRQSERLSVAEAVARFSSQQQELYQELGAAHEGDGAVDPVALARPYAHASLRYRFRDVVIELSVTNLGDGIVVREQYLDLAPPGDRHG